LTATQPSQGNGRERSSRRANGVTNGRTNAVTNGRTNGRKDANSNAHVDGGDYAAPVPSAPEPAEAARVEDTTHDGLMSALNDPLRTASLLAKVTYMARTRYGIRPNDAPDIFHESVATYLVVHGRYAPGDNHFGLLVGIFHLKALEFLAARQRTDRVASRLATRLRADRPDVARGEDPEGNAAERVVRDEDARLIREAIASLAPDAREMLMALADGRTSRLELIESQGLNANTFDTRLRAIRQRLRRALESTGVL